MFLARYIYGLVHSEESIKQMRVKDKKVYIRLPDEKLSIFLDRLRRFFKDRIQRVILFGSRARGDFVEESDYDFILVFDEVTQDVKDRLGELCLEMLLEHGMVISDFALTEGDLQRRRYEPFIMNATKEGIVL